MAMSGWTIKDPVGPYPREVAQYTTDTRKGGYHTKGVVRPLLCSIYAPTDFIAAPGANCRVRARLIWGDSGAAEQRADFDFRSCRVCVLASSMRLTLYTDRRQLSSVLASSAAPVQVLDPRCTIVMGPGSLTSSEGLIWTGYTNDVAANSALGGIPPWAKTIGLWQHAPAGAPVFAAPLNAGVSIYNPHGAAVDDTIWYPASEVWRKFAPLGPEGMNDGGACLYTGPTTPASLVSASFELEV